MKKPTLLLWLCLCIGLACQPTPPTQPTQPTLNEEDLEMVTAIFEEALVNGQAYEWLEHLCLNIGPRLSGSENAAKAIEWTKSIMEDEGFDQVFLQDVMVPHWERGAAEEARLMPSGTTLSVLALGGSPATPEGGIQAPVVMVTSLEEVDELGEQVKGKIVFYNRPFNQRHIQTGPGYGSTVDQRSQGAMRASQYGAVGIVIRSVSSAFDDVPHTGAQFLVDSIPHIPAAALGVQSADKLANALANNPDTELFLKMSCQWFDDAPSHNVVGELKGSEFPEKYIVVGGHLDSWDVGHGAHDDGSGCMQSIDVLYLMKKLGIQPRHTIRAVMFINEENGTRGGEKYADLAIENKEDHLIAIESDAGAFSPRGFGVSGVEDATLEKMRAWLPLFPQSTVSFINKGGGGVDIGPLHRRTATPMSGLSVDSQRNFDYHHSPNDTFDKVNRRELHLGSAALASFIYLIDKYGL